MMIILYFVVSTLVLRYYLPAYIRGYQLLKFLVSWYQFVMFIKTTLQDNYASKKDLNFSAKIEGPKNVSIEASLRSHICLFTK